MLTSSPSKVDAFWCSLDGRGFPRMTSDKDGLHRSNAVVVLAAQDSYLNCCSLKYSILSTSIVVTRSDSQSVWHLILHLMLLMKMSDDVDVRLGPLLDGVCRL